MLAFDTFPRKSKISLQTAAKFVKELILFLFPLLFSKSFSFKIKRFQNACQGFTVMISFLLWKIRFHLLAVSNGDCICHMHYGGFQL
jgi:hypothetical protein